MSELIECIRGHVQMEKGFLPGAPSFPFLGKGGVVCVQHHRSPLESVRNKYGFYICGYVVMPEHIHLMMSEPKML